MRAIAYGFTWISLNLLALLPPRVLYILSDFTFFLNYYIIRYRKGVVFKNLRESFPDKSDKEIKQIAIKFYKHLTDVFFEDIILMRISFKNIDKRMRYENLEMLNDLYKKGKDVAIIMGHYGNWEWPSSFASYTPYGLRSIYKQLHNPYFDRFFLNLRCRFGCEMFEVKSSFRLAYARKKNNLRTAIALIADQTPKIREMKYFTNFLNHPGTPIFLGAERMAKALDMAVVYADVFKPKRGHYVMEFKLLFEEVKDLPEYTITEAHVRMLENTIYRRPELWLWTHKRWKRTEKDLLKEEQVNEIEKNSESK